MQQIAVSKKKTLNQYSNNRVMGDPREVCWERDANILLAIYHVIVVTTQIHIHRHTVHIMFIMLSDMH